MVFALPCAELSDGRKCECGAGADDAFPRLVLMGVHLHEDARRLAAVGWGGVWVAWIAARRLGNDDSGTEPSSICNPPQVVGLDPSYGSRVIRPSIVNPGRKCGVSSATCAGVSFIFMELPPLSVGRVSHALETETFPAY